MAVGGLLSHAMRVLRCVVSSRRTQSAMWRQRWCCHTSHFPEGREISRRKHDVSH